MNKIKATTKEIEYTIVIRLPASVSHVVEVEQALDLLRGVGSAEIVDVKVVESGNG